MVALALKPWTVHSPRSQATGVQATVPDTALRHFVLYGQSLSIGSSPGGASVVSSPDPDHRMLPAGVRAHIDQLALGANENAPIDPAGCLTLVDLAEQVSSPDTNFGETMASGIAARLDGRHAFTSTGRGATAVEGLSRTAAGSITDQSHYHNTYAAMLYVSDAAEDNGWDYTIPAIGWKHGEANAVNGTTRSSYKTEALALFGDLRGDALAAAHFDASAVPVLTDQLSYRQDPYHSGTGDTATGYGAISVAIIEMHRAGDVICVGPSFDAEYVDVGDVHMTSQGYRNHGERWGVALAAIEAGSGWNPCHITAAVRSGTTITLTVHVPAAPLVKDTATFADRLFANDGFDYSGANITSVTITDDGSGDNTATIEITLDADAGGVLRFAYENARNNNWNTVGGHIRDSATETTASGKNLWNWLCTDEWSLA